MQPPSPYVQSLGNTKRVPQPCILVIFGATGDLTARKLIPALYNLWKEGQLPEAFACVGFARRPKSDELFRKEMQEAVHTFSRSQPVDPISVATFARCLFYHCSEFHEEQGYVTLKERLEALDKQLGTQGNRVFYLSTQPSFFSLVCSQLSKAALIRAADLEEGWTRVIIEKPFGFDLLSAQLLQQEITSFFKESQIYRIDHYLGKATVQNLFVFRFSNFIFESVWNNRYIDHVQITAGEEQGIGTRGVFWEETGLLRDIFQNHMMQLLSLLTMEPPTNLSSIAIHNEKVKVLQSIRRLTPEEWAKSSVRGQYGPAEIAGVHVPGYREEKNVNPKSQVETYLALKVHIDNWRWSGVPFYLRGGKRLAKRATEISIVFKEPPNFLLSNTNNCSDVADVLSLRIQPNEGASLKIYCKSPGSTGAMVPVHMDFQYSTYFGKEPPEAYERLILDGILGDNTLFIREDEALTAWHILTPLLELWKSTHEPVFPNYPAGSWGPQAADLLLEADRKRVWQLL